MHAKLLKNGQDYEVLNLNKIERRLKVKERKKKIGRLHNTESDLNGLKLFENLENIDVLWCQSMMSLSFYFFLFKHLYNNRLLQHPFL